MQQQPVTQRFSNEENVVARLGNKVRKWKDIATIAQKERDEARTEIEKLKNQVADLTGRADGNEAARQRDEALAQLRTLKHRQTFDHLAKMAGATTTKQIEDLWQLSGYKPEADEPDTAAIEALIAAQKAERSYLFNDQKTGNIQVPETKPGPGRGRGETDTDGQGAFTITKAQANDPLFMRDNAAKIWKAQLENRFAIADATLTR